jgi:DNA-binding GntR family transcriptional regulator
VVNDLYGAELPEIERSEPLRDKVRRALENLIVEEGLRPGQHLVEGELARRLGVSRNPIREALQLLARDGLVDLHPGRGAFVHEPSGDEVDNLFSVHTLLECEAARLAARNADADGITELRAVYERGVHAIAAGEIGKLPDINGEFHAVLERIGGNTVLSETLRGLEKRVRWYFAPLAALRAEGSWRQHAAIVDAIAMGEEERASQLMAEHVEATRVSFHQQYDHRAA